MLIIDSMLPFRFVKFLKKKSIEAILDMMRNFIIEAERITRQKLLRVWVDYK